MVAMLEALRHFPGLPHRTRFVGEQRGLRWYNDSKGTNVGATLAAIEGFSGPLVLIAGGVGKGQDFTPLQAAVAAKCRAVVVLGEAAPVLTQALQDHTRVIPAADMPAAVTAAADAAQAGDTVLLSPACASLDMFPDFAARGEAFTAAVEAL